LTILNNTAINFLQEWAIYDQESCSDHNIIQYALGNKVPQPDEYNHNGPRYVVTDENLKKFDKNLRRIVAIKFRTGQEEPENLDRDLATQVKNQTT